MIKIEAGELRIGNYIKSNNPIYRRDEFGKYLSVLAINEDSTTVTVIEDGKPIGYTFGQLYKYIEPIPITEEILLKCGAIAYDWKFLDYQHYIIKGSTDVILRIVSENEIVVFTNHLCDKSSKNYICKVGSLHRLQNAYVIITNEELNIIL